MDDGILYHGLDRLEVYCEGNMVPGLWDDLCEKKELAQSQGSPYADEEAGFLVHPTGRGASFQIGITACDGLVQISAGRFKKPVQATEQKKVYSEVPVVRESHEKDLTTWKGTKRGAIRFEGAEQKLFRVQHRIKLTFGSELCRRLSVQEAVDLAQNYCFQFLPENATRPKITRFDIAKDIQKTFSSDDSTGWIARSTTRNFYAKRRFAEHWKGRGFTGFVIGIAPIMLRLYNKSAEIKARKKGGEYPEEYAEGVWRTEFQIRKGKTVDVDFLDELPGKIAGVWAYLTGKWVRMGVPGSNRRRSRWGVDDRWRTIQGFSPSWDKKNWTVSRKSRYSSRASDLIIQGLGCFKNAMILQSIGEGREPSKRNLLEMVARSIIGEDDWFSIPSWWEYSEDLDFESDIKRRRERLCLLRNESIESLTLKRGGGSSRTTPSGGGILTI